MKNIILILFLFIGSQLFSQSQRRSYTNLGLQYVRPLVSASDFQGGPFWGFNGGSETPIFGSPIEIGFDYSWAAFDSEEREFVQSYLVSTTGQYTYDYSTIQFRNTNSRVLSNIRFKLFNGPIQPYADLVFGFESYRVSSEVTSSTTGYSNYNGSNFQYFDITSVSGWSTGLRVSSNQKLFVDFKIQNLKSGRVNYIDLDSVIIVDGQNINYNITQIRPKKFVFQVGLSYTY